MKSVRHFDHYYGIQTWELPGGKLHRLDGPALIFADGTRFWHVDGWVIPPEAIKSLASVKRLLHYLREECPLFRQSLLKLAIYRKLINRKQADNLDILLSL